MANKLQLIAQLSGSFAVGALVAKHVPSLPGSEDGISNLASVFLPRTAHAFTMFRTTKASSSQIERVKTFHALGADGKYVKVYPVEFRIKSLGSQFELNTLRLALLRALVFTYAPLVEAYFKELHKAENEAAELGREADWDDLPKFDWEEAKNKIPWVTFLLARDLSVGIVRILLSWGAVRYLDSRLVWKLVKDQTSSFRAKRRFAFYKRPYIVMRTCLRGLVISTLAELLLSSALETFRILHSARVPRRSKATLVRRRLTGRVFTLTVNLVASSAAAGAVSLIVPPGIVCIGASLLAGFGSDMLISVPAVQEYEAKGRVTRGTVIIAAVCVGVVVWSFLPWFLPTAGSSHNQLQTALAQPMM